MKYFYFVSFVAYRDEDTYFSSTCCETNGPLDKEESIFGLEAQFVEMLAAKGVGPGIKLIKFISFQLLRTEEEKE